MVLALSKGPEHPRKLKLKKTLNLNLKKTWLDPKSVINTVKSVIPQALILGHVGSIWSHNWHQVLVELHCFNMVPQLTLEC